jgi:hypothetical protein
MGKGRSDSLEPTLAAGGRAAAQAEARMEMRGY